MRRGILIGGAASLVTGLAVTLGLRKWAERRAARAAEAAKAAELAARPDATILDFRTGRRLRIVRDDEAPPATATGT